MTRARRWAWVSWAATVALPASGCYEGFDPLDPEVLAEVARSRGDAQGVERSGVYVGLFEVIECGCADVDSLFDVSLCVTIDRLEEIGVSPELALEVVQADGTVRVQAVGLGELFEAEAGLLPVFYGALQANGRVSAAGVLQADAVAVQGQVLGRIDGSIEMSTEGWVLVGEYQQRYAIDLLGEPDVLDIGLPGAEVQSVDCRERIALDLLWASPPFTPVGGF